MGVGVVAYGAKQGLKPVRLEGFVDWIGAGQAQKTPEVMSGEIEACQIVSRDDLVFPDKALNLIVVKEFHLIASDFEDSVLKRQPGGVSVIPEEVALQGRQGGDVLLRQPDYYND